MRNLGVIANTSKKDAPHILSRLSAKAEELGIKLFSNKETGQLVECCKVVDVDTMCRNADAVLALGGDGTVLRTVRLLNSCNIPVMGINMGGLGFLTSVSHAELEKAIECIAADSYSISSRSVINCKVLCNGKKSVQYRALNDVVIATGGSMRVVSLDVSVNGESVTSYICDGLIISTPTGSTGHALSAGGPIVTPDTQSFVIGLICPHTLSSRPLLVPDTGTITVRVAASEDEIPLSIDGQVGQSLKKGDSIEAQRAPETVRFLHLPGYSYFSVLRRKLNWSGRNV